MDWAQLGMLLIEGPFDLTVEILRVANRAFPETAWLIRALSETRFKLHERRFQDVKRYLWILDNYTKGIAIPAVDRRALQLPKVLSDEARYNIVMLWLTLARDNRLLDRVIFPFDAVERDWQNEFESLLRAVELWSEVGCPLGVVFGFQNDFNDLDNVRDDVQVVSLG